MASPSPTNIKTTPFEPSSVASMFDVSLPEKIADRWKLGKMIGTGAHGDVFEAFDIVTGEPVAAKLEPIESHFESLSKEREVYQALKKSSSDLTGFAKVLFYGKQDDFDILVMSRLGRSLQHYWARLKPKISANTVLKIGEQVVSRLQRLHTAGYHHGDVTLKNILVGQSDPETLYLVDFGISRKLPSATEEVSRRREDLLDLGMELVNLFTGRMPVLSGGKSESTKRDNVDIVKSMCNDVPQIARYFKYIYKHGVERESDYDRLRAVLQEGLDDRNGKSEVDFDWIKKTRKRKKR